jgi:hypothetical protein
VNTSALDPLIDQIRTRALDPLIGQVRNRLHLQKERSSLASIGGAALILGVAASGAYLAFNYCKRARVTKQHKQVEKVRDKTLKDSFPASDPPASQFYDIPVNRR